MVPENRRLFGPMTVLENLQLGAFTRSDVPESDYEYVFDLFPRVAERRHQLAETLSGGDNTWLPSRGR